MVPCTLLMIVNYTLNFSSNCSLDEMRRRREFYEEHETCRPANPLDSGQVFDELYITSDDVMHLSLEYMTDDEKLRVLYFIEINEQSIYMQNFVTSQLFILYASKIIG